MIEYEDEEKGIKADLPPQVTNLHNWMKSGTIYQARQPGGGVATLKGLGDIRVRMPSS